MNKSNEMSYRHIRVCSFVSLFMPVIRAGYELR